MPQLHSSGYPIEQLRDRCGQHVLRKEHERGEKRGAGWREGSEADVGDDLDNGSSLPTKHGVYKTCPCTSLVNN
jgi:hypothetical protein